MNDTKGRNGAPPTAEGQAVLRVDVHLKRRVDEEKQGYHLLYLLSRQTAQRLIADEGHDSRWRSRNLSRELQFSPF